MSLILVFPCSKPGVGKLFSVKRSIGNVFGFVDHTASVIAIHFCSCSMTAAADNMRIHEHDWNWDFTWFLFIKRSSSCFFRPLKKHKNHSSITGCVKIAKVLDLVYGPVSRALLLFMDMRVGPWRRLSTEEWMLSDCGAGEDSWESLGPQGGQTSPS